jgi:hypothetical protein
MLSHWVQCLRDTVVVALGFLETTQKFLTYRLTSQTWFATVSIFIHRNE